MGHLRTFTKTRRFRMGIGIEGGLRESLVARPEAGSAHLVRIRFTRDRGGQPDVPPGWSGAARPEKRLTADGSRAMRMSTTPSACAMIRHDAGGVPKLTGVTR